MSKRFNLRSIVIAVAALVLLVTSGILVKHNVESRHAQNVQDQAQELYYGDAAQTAGTEAAASDEAVTIAPDPDSWVAEENAGLRIHKDFQELYETNNDLVGWLKAGEAIDYPVVKRDNSYYLTHDIYQNSDANGTLFVNQGNTMNPRDDVILIHGHFMGTGRMFGTLNKFENYKYMSEHPLVSFRTVFDAEDVYYTPISVFNASMTRTDPSYFNVEQIRFENDDGSIGAVEGRKSQAFQSYLDGIMAKSLWKPKVDINVNDKLLMLITCSYIQDDGRLMVLCRALRDDETPESITAIYQETK